MKNSKQEWSIPKEVKDRLNEDKKKGFTGLSMIFTILEVLHHQ